MGGRQLGFSDYELTTAKNQTKREKFLSEMEMVAGIGGVGVLGDRHPKGVGVQAHLGDKTRCARSGLIDRTPQGLAACHQGVDALGDARLGWHPLQQQGIESIDIELRQEQPEGRVRRRVGDVGAEQLVEGLGVAFGKTLHPEQRTLVAHDGQDRHQQHPPLRIANPPAQTAIGKRLQDADQIRCSGWVLKRRGQEYGRDLRTKPELSAAHQGYWDRLLVAPLFAHLARSVAQIGLRPVERRNLALDP